MNPFTYNRGLREREPGEVVTADVELHKVTHLDIDNAIKGCESEIKFVTTADEGFLYLKDIKDVVKAYHAGTLYVVEGNY